MSYSSQDQPHVGPSGNLLQGGLQYLPSIHEIWDAFDAEDFSEDQHEPLQKRLRTGHGCDICGTSYSEKRTLVRHLSTPGHCKNAGIKVPVYGCRICSDKFSRDDIRQRHEKEVHFQIKRSRGHNRPSMTKPSSSEETDMSTFCHVAYENATIPTDHHAFITEELPVPVSKKDSALPGIGHSAGDCPVASVPSQKHGDGSDEDTKVDSVHHLTRSDDQKALDKESIEARGEIDDLSTDRMSIHSASTIGSCKSHTRAISKVLRSTLVYRGASACLRGYKIPVQCALCQELFGGSIAEIREHLGKHSKTYHSEDAFSCQICQITFTHERDSRLHEISAKQGHCGFNFDHIEPCEGHHPPDIYSQMLTDSDRLQFSSRLGHWEQAQLKGYLQQINDLINGDPIPFDLECWSIGALRSSIGSISSQISRAMQRSAPDPSDYQGRLGRRMPLSLFRLRGDALRRPEDAPTSRNLVYAAILGDATKIKRLVLEGSNVNAFYRFQQELSHISDKLGYRLLLTALEAAITSGKLNAVQALIQLGADVNLTGSHQSPYDTPLGVAAMFGNDEIVRLLLSTGARVNPDQDDECVRAPLNCAISSGRYDTVQLLLEHGAQVKQSGRIGNALIDAVSYGRIDMVQLLIHHGAAVNTEDQSVSVLDFAARGGRKAMFEFLSHRETNTNAQSLALELAMYRYDMEMVQFLVLHGAKLHGTVMDE